MNTEHNEIKEKLFLDGIDLYNQKQFYEAHEIWEELWTEYRQVDDKFIQALCVFLLMSNKNFVDNFFKN